MPAVMGKGEKYEWLDTDPDYAVVAPGDGEIIRIGWASLGITGIHGKVDNVLALHRQKRLRPDRQPGAMVRSRKWVPGFGQQRTPYSIEVVAIVFDAPL